MSEKESRTTIAKEGLDFEMTCQVKDNICRENKFTFCRTFHDILSFYQESVDLAWFTNLNVSINPSFQILLSFISFRTSDEEVFIVDSLVVLDPRCATS
jgi:hypothetical protein